jgi:hypothetical protein
MHGPAIWLSQNFDDLSLANFAAGAAINCSIGANFGK